MIVLKNGYIYQLKNFEHLNDKDQVVYFIEKRTAPLKEGSKVIIKNEKNDYYIVIDIYTDTARIESTSTQNRKTVDIKSLQVVELEVVNNGTTNEEVLKMLISRLNFQNEKFKSEENTKAIEHLVAALDLLKLWKDKRNNKKLAKNIQK